MNQNQIHTQQGILINSKFITSTVGVIAIFSALFAVFNKVNSYEYRLDKIEYNDVIRSNETKTLISELKVLNNQLTDLTIELKEMKATQKSREMLPLPPYGNYPTQSE